MEKSENINELITALIGFHKDVGKITKNANNPFYKSNYGDLNSYLSEVKEPLVKNGLVIIQLPTTNGLTTLLSHTSGQYISESMTMQPSKNDPQGQGSALTYMRRYSLASVLNLNAEDDDGNEATRSTTKPKQAPQSKKKEERLNYTELASGYTTNEELGKWFNALDATQKQEASAVVKNRKEDIEKESKSNTDETIIDMINRATEKEQFEKVISYVEKHDKEIKDRAKLSESFNARADKLKIEIALLPF